MIDFDYMLEALLEGDDIVDDLLINDFACNILNGNYNMDDPLIIHNLKTLITICNILYNNSDRSILPVEDGVYDMLVVLANKYIPDIQVGAPVTDIKVTQPVKLSSPWIKEDELSDAFIKVDPNKIETGVYTESLINQTPEYTKEQLYVKGVVSVAPISKKVMNTPHEYPKLVGTLDKCKFVLNHQAEERGVLNDDNVAVFERDFLYKHVSMGIVDPTNIRMLATLKMDGVSVEATVSDHIISARSRGDTNNDVATDLTAVLGKYNFPKAVGYVDDEHAFGMKFECMLSNLALTELGTLRNVDYANPRNAIIGLLGAGDGNQWIDYITLVPLETSLDIDPLEEVIFMNELYAKEPLRYAVIEGTYEQVLFQVSRFVQEAEFLRPVMSYIYDGVVLTYLDKDVRERLGRVNSVNKYSIAIKFNPEKKQTRFLGYTYSVGQNGVITPIAHYQPVELFGAIHAKTTAHSLSRFNELGLREGDIVNIELMNDVIPYISKAEIYENDCNTNPVIPFPTECPSCGTKLEISKSGKTAICPNIHCPERKLSMMTNMLSKLGFKDFSEETLRTIDCIHSLSDLIYVEPKDLESLGPVERANFFRRVQELLNANHYDYVLVGALGFTNISQERWAIILKNIRLEDIVSLPDDELKARLLSIKSIGSVIADTIVTERELLRGDLLTICNDIPHKVSYGSVSKLQIRFTGCRDKELELELKALGYDISGDAGVTKTTDILLVPYQGFESSKTKKVKDTCLVISLDEFKSNKDSYLSM